MKVSKTLKWILGSILGTFILLFIILIVHIATAKPIAYDNATLQISRIDFKETIDSVKAKEIHRNLKAIPGVKNDRLNIKTGVLVYFHDNRIVDSKTVYEQLIVKGPYKAERYVISEELATKKVCPIMNTNSFSYKFSRGIQRIFN
ncbi:hypothetical protein LZZ90_12060 [Flavobacterium sp. SM15]|uniref:hypothetical protein n=1 Tax=Flavobacterium sp. SM15 TaxID=2908005 RepID=UPI001EDA66B2|nr:hypothetical protein [Flavobacterium sp. SM15]MCG2612240.1 hypothetical protein [Flavobacterium sp. SM15]